MNLIDETVGTAADAVTVLASTANTTVNGLDTDDTLTVEADTMANGTTLTITGAAATTVNDVQSAITIDGNVMTDTLVVNLIDETVGTAADTITVVTSQTNTTVNAADADDTVNINATVLADDHALSITGASTVNVTNLIGDISAALLTGDLHATIKAGGASSTIVGGSGNDTVVGSTSADVLRLTSIETVNADSGNDQITVTDSSLKRADLGVGDDTLTLLASTAATIIGGLGNDLVTGSNSDSVQSGDDVLTLTTVETVNSGSGNDDITVTDEVASITLGDGNDTLTFEVGGAVDNGTVTGGTGTDTVNVNVNASLTLTLDVDFSEVEVVNFVDQGEAGFDVSVTLDASFNNQNAVLFDASSLDAGEVLTFDASRYVQTDQITVKGGTGDDVFITAANDAARGAMTIDLGTKGAGGNDKVLILNAGAITVGNLTDVITGPSSTTDQLGGTVLDGFFSAPTAANVTPNPDVVLTGSITGDSGNEYRLVSFADNDTANSGELRFTGLYSDAVTEWQVAGVDGLTQPGRDFVTIKGFTAGDGAGYDQLAMTWITSDGGTTVNMSGGGFTNAQLNSTLLDGATDGGVINVNTVNYQLSDYTDLKAVAALLSNNGQGNALLGLTEGNYSVILYNGTSSTADGFIYNLKVGGGDGFDFNSSQPLVGNYNFDADSLELVAKLEGVGAGSLIGDNFIPMSQLGVTADILTPPVS